MKKSVLHFLSTIKLSTCVFSLPYFLYLTFRAICLKTLRVARGGCSSPFVFYLCGYWLRYVVGCACAVPICVDIRFAHCRRQAAPVLWLLFICGCFPSVSYASSPPNNDVHICAVLDYEQYRSDHPPPATKRLTALNVGEPRTVRIIHFLPKDRPFRAEVIPVIKDEVSKAQTFLNEQMQMHGYNDRTFRIETDALGELLIHRVDGQHPASYYIDEKSGRQNWKYMDEIEQMFDLNVNIYVIYRDIFENDSVGFGGRRGKVGGFVSVATGFVNEWDWVYMAHELGHAFGLQHDFTNDAYVMSYGPAKGWKSLSACHAALLSVHPYFNPAIPTEGGAPPIINLTSETEYPASSESVPIRVEVSDPDGLHHVVLHAAALSGLATTVINGRSVKGCHRLNGEKDAVVEFDYDGAFWKLGDRHREGPLSSLSDSPEHAIVIQAVDTYGNSRYTRQIKLMGIGSYEIDKPFEVTKGVQPHHIFTIKGYTDEVNQVVFSPDGTLLISGGRGLIEGGSVRLWNAETGQNLATLNTGTLADRPGVNRVAISPDGTLLASGQASGVGGGAIRLWDVETGEIITTLLGHILGVTGLAFSPDGTLLASAAPGAAVKQEDDTIRLWDIATKQTIATLTTPEVTITFPSSPKVTGLAFSPDGALLASGGRGNDGTIRLWDVATRQAIATLEGHQLQVFSLAFSPDGTLLASASRDGTMLLWDIATRQPTTLPKAYTDWIFSVAFSPDGTLLASGGRDTMVRLWNVTTRQNIATFAGHTDWVHSVAFSPDGTLLVSGGNDGTIRLWDPMLLPTPDFNGDGTIDLADFLQFVAHFGSSKGDEVYEARYDLDGDGTIGIDDFLIFVNAFGKSD